MTFNIAELFRIALTTLAIVPLALTLNFTAALAESPIDRIQNSNLQIARNPLAPGTQPRRNNSVCMKYVRQGLQAEEAGDESKSLEYYIQAVQVDERCAYAYLFAAEKIAKFDKPTAIQFGTAAAACFSEEEDREGLEATLELLKSFGVEF